jgi:capsular exopolysaccharide synthesis family protein
MSVPQMVHVCLVRQRKLFLVTLLATLAAVVGVTLALPDVYRSTATLIVGDRTVQDGDARADEIEALARTYAQLLETPAITSATLRRLPPGTDAGSLESQTSFEAVTGTRLLRIRAEDRRPEDAQAIANAYADALIDTERRRTGSSGDRALADLEARIRDQVDQVSRFEDSTDPRGEAELEIARDRLEALTASYRRLADRVAERAQPISLASSAALPSSPIKPRPRLYVLGGGILSLLLALGAALLRDSFDQRVRGEEELVGLVGAPVLSRLPDSTEPSTEQLDDAFQLLRSNLQLGDFTRETRVLAVVSAEHQEGKSTVATGLAAALAASGADVIAVDCDLRTPTLHGMLGVEREPGIADILASVGEGAPLPGVRTEAPGEADGILQPSGLTGVRVCAAGAPSPHPPVLLTSPRLSWLLGEFRNQADYVLVDTPPVTIGADASLVAASADGVIMVVDSRRARCGPIAAACAQIRKANTPIAGIVVNPVRRRSRAFGILPYAAGEDVAEPIDPLEPTAQGPAR